MVAEGEGFIGNPIKVEYDTDDELEYEEGDNEVGAVVWYGEEDDIETEEEEFNLRIGDGTSDYGFSDEDSGEESDDGELRLVQMNGLYVEVGAAAIENETSENGGVANDESVTNDIDNNEVMKSAPSPAVHGVGTSQDSAEET